MASEAKETARKVIENSERDQAKLRSPPGSRSQVFQAGRRPRRGQSENRGFVLGTDLECSAVELVRLP
jgi:hypothetical protein